MGWSWWWFILFGATFVAIRRQGSMINEIVTLITVAGGVAAVMLWLRGLENRLNEKIDSVAREIIGINLKINVLAKYLPKEKQKDIFDDFNNIDKTLKAISNTEMAKFSLDELLSGKFVFTIDGQIIKTDKTQQEKYFLE